MTELNKKDNDENHQSIRYVENKQLATVADLFFFCVVFGSRVLSFSSSVLLIELVRCWRGEKGVVWCFCGCRANKQIWCNKSVMRHAELLSSTWHFRDISAISNSSFRTTHHTEIKTLRDQKAVSFQRLQFLHDFSYVPIKEFYCRSLCKWSFLIRRRNVRIELIITLCMAWVFVFLVCIM